MIDKMIRCEKLDTKSKIRSLCEWYDKCPPKAKLKHWKEGRSAKETAKHWLHTIPQSFKDLLKTHQLKYILCSPEYESKFDSYRNGRNHDLLLIAEDKDNKKVVISIESKVDESFGYTVEKTSKAAEKTKLKNGKSKASERIADLRKDIFGKENDNQEKLMYQLLTALAGTIAEAKKQRANTAFFLVQTFVEKENSNHINNKKDLNNLISVFSKSEYNKIENNEVLGPFKIGTNNEYLSDKIDLWIGKYEIEI